MSFTPVLEVESPQAHEAHEAHEPPTIKDARFEWFTQARFGLFLHFGLYSILGGAWKGIQTNGSPCGDKATEDRSDHYCGYAEWIRENGQIPLAAYNQLASQWDPSNFNPKAIAALAKEAGMGYVVLTTKHHEGFALWPSNAPGAWSVKDAKNTRDAVLELANAVRNAGLKMGLYYSIMDWHHDLYVPRRTWESHSRPRLTSNLTEGYLDFMHAQLRELLTSKGEISIVWFDGEWEKTWSHEYAVQTYALIRSLNPNVLVNNRVDVYRKGFGGFSTKNVPAGVTPVGDFGTPEQNIPATGMGNTTWESCITMNDNWGYHRADRRYKSAGYLIRALVNTASKGGNLLLNVGPRPDGTLPEEAVGRLKRMGEWMRVHAEAIVGTRANPITQPIKCCKVTARDGAKGVVLFLFVLRVPADGWIMLPGTLNEPLRASVMGTGKELQVERRINWVAIRVDAGIVGTPNDPPRVVKLELEGALEPVLPGDQ